ncbi:RNA polymerase sigma factor SigJ [Microcella humidisoli]|uniref:RNA polymerase sigma factor SigJ n=1 Tax=Microcella humidisoli TaxID=2963406 RepID=A0ABY5FX32_9MICO|nr:RNA polymerase sigma factor SigJ [Microcella humidisoli]UTT62492.1 RNA polymerase sigma factor SigJ [Microcella humidisoli]
MSAFEAARPRLTGLAYRLLGSWAEAEDVVQDAWPKWAAVAGPGIANPDAYLTTMVTRLALTALDSARVRREQYVGPWLPEPVDTRADPALGAETAEDLDLATLLLLERLSGPERAALVLREAFAYDYACLAEVLGTSEAAARQLVSRGRRALEGQRRQRVDEAQRGQLLAAFVAAAQGGDLAALEAVLVDDAVAISDGGGVVSAARRPVHGAEQVARFVLGVLEKFGQGVRSIPVQANGETAFLAIAEGPEGVEPVALWALDIGDEGVRGVLIVRAPDKLARFAAAALSQIDGPPGRL